MRRNFYSKVTVIKTIFLLVIIILYLSIFIIPLEIPAAMAQAPSETWQDIPLSGWSGGGTINRHTEAENSFSSPYYGSSSETTTLTAETYTYHSNNGRLSYEYTQDTHTTGTGREGDNEYPIDEETHNTQITANELLIYLVDRQNEITDLSGIYGRTWYRHEKTTYQGQVSVHLTYDIPAPAQGSEIKKAIITLPATEDASRLSIAGKQGVINDTYFGQSYTVFDVTYEINTGTTVLTLELTQAADITASGSKGQPGGALTWHYEGVETLFKTGTLPVLHLALGMSKINQQRGESKDKNSETADPVNITNGNMYSQAQDLYIPGRGLSIDFSRAYNSQDDYNGPLGCGWTHSYNIFLTETYYGSLIEMDEDGSLIEFTYENNWQTGSLNGVDISNDEVKLKTGIRVNDLPQSSAVRDFWKFEEPGGKIEDELAADKTGIYNGSLYQQPGKGGYALGFDGDDYVSLPAGSLGFGRDDNTTLSLWFRAETKEPERYLLSWAYDVPGCYFYFWPSLHEGAFYHWCWGSNDISIADTSRNYQDGQWHNYTLVQTGGETITHKLYLDGIYIGEDTASCSIAWAASDTHLNFIGAGYNHAHPGTTRYYHGQIDELVIWADALSDNDIASLMTLWDNITYTAQGSITLKHDAGSVQPWQSYSITADESNGTNVKVRFRSADSEAGLETAVWSRYYDSARDYITDIPAGRWLETEVVLESDGSRTYTPVLKQLAVNYSYGSKTWQSGFKSPEHTLITKNKDNTYTLTKKDGARYNFNTTSRLSSIVDRNGNETTLTYTNSLLTAVSDTSGLRQLTFSYNTDNRIKTITDPAGRIINYSYDINGNLISFTDRLGNITNYYYDSEHNMTRITDASGRSRYFSYDDQDRTVSSWFDNDNYKTILSYDPGNMTTQTTDALGNTTTYGYNTYGVIETITDPAGNTASYTWDNNINRTSATDANGHTAYFAYDDRGNVVHVTNPDNTAATFSYTFDYNQIANITDALGRQTIYTYDSQGNLSYITDDNNNSTTNNYAANGSLLKTTDAEGNPVYYDYDSYGNLSIVTDAEGNSSYFIYDILGSLAGVKDANNNTSYHYDLNNQLEKIVYPDTTQINYTYDPVGNKISVQDQNNNTTSYAYDEVNRLIKVTDALNQLTSYGYDKLGNRTSVTDAKGNTTTYTYNNLSRLEKVITPLGNTITYQYDKTGNRTVMTDANGWTISYSYDENNRLTQIRYPDNSIVSFRYDAIGNRRYLIDSTGTTIYTYDNLNRLTQVVSPGNKIINYTYDRVGNRLSMTDQDGKVTTYNYKNNKLETIIDPLGKTTVYQYDKAANLIRTDNPDGTYSVYTYNSLNQLEDLSNYTPANTVLSSYHYDYDPAGMRVAVTDKDSTATSYNYDSIYRLTREEKAGQSPYYNGYTYDPAGNRLTKQGTVINEACNYDPENRLLARAGQRLKETTLPPGLAKQDKIPDGFDKGKKTGFTESNTPVGWTSAGAKTGWTNTSATNSGTGTVTQNTWQKEQGKTKTQNQALIDQYSEPQSKSNLNSKTNSSSKPNFSSSLTSSFAQNSQAAQTTASQWEQFRIDYTYDNNGNLITTAEYAGNAVTPSVTAYFYDYENRLVKIIYPDGSSSEYTYDGVGKRVQAVERDANGAITKAIGYYYDGLNCIIERALIIDPTTGQPTGVETTVASYLRGLSYGGGIGGIISKTDASGQSFYFHYDGIGTVTSLTDSLGNVVQTYTADAFGNPLTSTGSVENSYQFSTKEFSAKNNLVYFGARYYDPRVGRWTQKDPLGMIDGPNLYLYVHANPINLIDPFGFAEVGMRPLGNPATRALADLYYGKRNRSGMHWHIFYRDDTNSGYLGDDPKSKLPRFGADDPKLLETYEGTLIENLDDRILEKAEQVVQERWLREFKEGKRRYNHPRNDCQTYIIEAYVEYIKIKRAKETGQR